ncbi:hypothetical protein KID03_01740 [bacterium]|nr:hypothetical protein [bacterium]
MYRCTECKEEFKEKPEYCTCGNDEFEEFTAPPVKDSTFQKEQPTLPHKNFDFKKFDMVKVFSIGFFCLCLILAVIPWLIKAEKPAKTVQKPKEEVVQTIPDIESIWQNAKPQTPAAETAPKPEPSPKIVKTTEPPKPKTQTTSTTQKPAAAAKTQPKPVSKTTSAASKPVKKDPPVQPAVQPKPKLPQSVLNTVQKTTSTQQTVQKPVKKEEPPKMNPSEFLNYKGAIRSALLAKLNVAAVQGSGDCAIEFSLDNSGKLINRNFIYKSQNKSVNDEVYLMLMRLPYYKNPPAHYNGEKIKLKFLFNNGYYEITFI